MSPVLAASLAVTALAPVSFASCASEAVAREFGHGNLVPESGQTTGQRAADLSRSDDSNFHFRTPVFANKMRPGERGRR